MSVIAIGMNLLLACLLAAALVVGFRLNRRLKALRDSHTGFAKAVAELDAAAHRAEQGLADLRAATDEAAESLADRIEKAKALVAKLDRLTENAPAARAAAEPEPEIDRPFEQRLGALLAAARDSRGRPAPPTQAEPVRMSRLERPAPKLRRAADDDLFDDEPLELARISSVRGGRR